MSLQAQTLLPTGQGSKTSLEHSHRSTEYYLTAATTIVCGGVWPITAVVEMCMTSGVSPRPDEGEPRLAARDVAAVFS